MTLTEKFQPQLSCDNRSLQLFRILLGLASALSFSQKFLNFKSFYSFESFLPEISTQTPKIFGIFWSLNFLNLNNWFQYTLLLLGIALSMCFILKIQPKLSALFLIILSLSFENRNVFVLQGADVYLRALFFCSLFINFKNIKVQPAIATAPLLFQVIFVYLFSATYKLNDAGWMDGSALRNALLTPLANTELSHFIASPFLTSLLSKTTLILEGLAPLLLFVKQTRIIAIVTLFFFHLCISFVLEVGLFGFVSMAALSAFIPTYFWPPLKFSQDGAKAGQSHRSNWTRLAPLLAVGILFLFNLDNMLRVTGLADLPNAINRVEAAFGLTQRWRMFTHIKHAQVLTISQVSDVKETVIPIQNSSFMWKTFYQKMLTAENARKIYSSYQCKNSIELKEIQIKVTPVDDPELLQSQSIFSCEN